MSPNGTIDNNGKGLPDAPAGLFQKLWQGLVAPRQKLITRSWRIAPRGWTRPMRVVMISDLHMGAPYMPLARLDEVITRAQALSPDLVLLPGDLTPGPSMARTITPPLEEIATRLARLSAPLGTYAVLGNHDWWEDPAAQAREAGPVETGQALQDAGIPVLTNSACELANGVWLAGLDSQEAIYRSKREFIGRDDLDAALSGVPEGAPTLLLAHEPQVFARVPDSVAVTFSGHTHGGQIRVFGHAPVLPRAIDRRFVFGHITDGPRHLVISSGVGYSKMPLRIGTPPEVTLVELIAQGTAGGAG